MANKEQVLKFVREHLGELNRPKNPKGIKTLAKEYAAIHGGEVENIRYMMRYYMGRTGRNKGKVFEIRDRSRSETQPKRPYRYAKVLIFDIETSPIIAYTWGIWGQNIPTDNIIKDWLILTWAAKWLFEDKVYSAKITPKEIKADDDSRVVKALWAMIEEADIIIAHNAAKFDVKRMNTRFLKHRLGLPSPYQVIDTLKHARKKFNITSNRLDYIAKDFLGIDGKMETPKGLWKRCIEGSAEALTMMDEYCIKDVYVLEDVYMHLRPYIQPHPNIGLLEDSSKPQCPCCGSEELTEIGEYRTYVNTFMAFRCPEGSISRARVNSTPRKTRDNLNVSTPQ